MHQSDAFSFPTPLETLATTLYRKSRYWLLREYRNAHERVTEHHMQHVCRVAVWELAQTTAHVASLTPKDAFKALQRFVRSKDAGETYAVRQGDAVRKAPTGTEWTSWTFIRGSSVAQLGNILHSSGTVGDGYSAGAMHQAYQVPSDSASVIGGGDTEDWSTRFLAMEEEDPKVSSVVDRAYRAVVAVLDQECPKVAVLLKEHYCEELPVAERIQHFIERHPSPDQQAKWLANPDLAYVAYHVALDRAAKKARKVITKHSPLPDVHALLRRTVN